MAGLTHAELAAVAQEEAFTERVVDMAEHTFDYGVETGLVVYKPRDGGPITFSEVLKPAELDEYDEHSTAEVDHGLGPVLNLGRLITDSDVQLRSDLAVVSHTHPLTYAHRRKPRAMLLPSATDLISFGEWAAVNPGVIGGVVATHGELGGTAVRLFRGITEDYLQRLQTVEEGANIQESTLTTLGLGTAVLVYNRRTGRLRLGLETLAQLYG